jgi:dUTP pyrophosphatase
VTLVNAPGTIDAGYRGQIQVVMLNTDRRETVQVRRGDRIGQLVIQRVERAVFRPVGALPESLRGTGGFGSTGGFGTGGARDAAGTGGMTGEQRHEGGDGVPA